ncbi:MAG TPA: hypothetical protein VK134_03265 [Ktedonobacteraceae bacterium]|nr:hypothetical protein [Ktedonobacteraceae bacterium]
MNTEALTTQPGPEGDDKGTPSTGQVSHPARHHPRIYGGVTLWVCLLVAVATRVWLVIHTHGVIDGDEALVGIQAEHILRGELPVYFSGQPYLGSLETYCIALLFAIFGSSVWVLRAEPILMSLILVWLTWRLASVLAGVAQLPSLDKSGYLPPRQGAYARRYFVTSAALLAAVPPLYDGIAEMRTWGGLIETLILMLLLLLSALQLTRRWRAGASKRELALRWAGIGFIVGLGFWIYPLIISAVLAAAAWIVCGVIAEVVRLRRQDAATLRQAITTMLAGLLPAAAAIPASLLGFAPALYWGATHQWQNITYILGLGGGTLLQRLSTIRKVTRLYVTCVAPRVISGAVPRESAALAALHSPLLILGALCILVSATLVAFSFLAQDQWLLRVRRLVGLPLLFGACTALIFCASTVSSSGLLSTCNADFAGRYGTPLVLALPFFFAAVFTMARMSISVGAGVGMTRGGGLYGRPPQPTIHPSRPPVGRIRLPFVVQGVLLAFLLGYLGMQAWTYGLTDAATTFQSPFCLEAPANNDAIIAYMQSRHITRAWAPNLLGYPIVFKTNGSIIIANPLALTNPPQAINRIPAYTSAVQQADRPSFLVFARHDDLHPPLLKMLDDEGVTYQAARFPSEPGFDVLVVTPVSRTVSPLESKAFNGFFICSE